MIARIWRGWVRSEDADAYVEYLHETGIAEYRATPGNRAALHLASGSGRADRVHHTHVLGLPRRPVKAFAGDDIEQAVYYPEDDRFLIERETTVTHFELLE